MLRILNIFQLGSCCQKTFFDKSLFFLSLLQRHIPTLFFGQIFMPLFRSKCLFCEVDSWLTVHWRPLKLNNSVYLPSFRFIILRLISTRGYCGRFWRWYIIVLICELDDRMYSLCKQFKVQIREVNVKMWRAYTTSFYFNILWKSFYFYCFNDKISFMWKRFYALPGYSDRKMLIF